INNFCSGSAAIISDYILKRLNKTSDKEEQVIVNNQNMQTVKAVNAVNNFTKYAIELVEGGVLFMDVPQDCQINCVEGDKIYTSDKGDIGFIAKESIH
ncbi:MAG: hypothetical protein ABIP51_17300, partial [Bacteroidia bacterium]